MTSHAPPESNGSLGPISGQRLRAVALAGIALAGGLWVTGQLDHRTEQAFPGHLQARMLTVTAEKAARLQEVRVQPGQRIKIGEPLLVLDSGQRPDDVADRQQRALRSEQEAIRAKAAADLELHWRRRELQSEIFQTQFKLAGLRQEKLHQEVEQIAWRETLAVKDVFAEAPRVEPLFKFLTESAGDVPEQRVRAMLREDAAVSAAQALASQITLCEQRLEELRTLDRGLEAQIRLSHGVDAAEEQRKLAAEQIAAVAETPSTTTVASPGYGLVGLTKKQAGDLVQPGDVLVQILDDARQTIEVEIPSRSVVRFTPGQQIRLEFPGPERRLGLLSSISPQTTDTATATPDADGDALVRLIIEPAGKAWPSVPIGSRVLVFQP